MPICFERGFAFVHVQKTAGVSLVTALQHAGLKLDYCDRGVLEIFAAHPKGLEFQKRLRDDLPLASLTVFPQQHLPAAILRELVGAEEWQRCFTFGFVRNPWDRLVSLYHYLKAHMANAAVREAQPGMAALVDRASDFTAFVSLSQVIGNDLSKLLLDERGVLLVDFVGRFERMEEDLAYIAQQIGIALTLPRLNGSVHNNYREYYTPTTRAVVAKRYAQDIETFGYTF